MVALLSEEVVNQREQNRDETAVSFGTTTQIVALHFLILLLAAVVETRVMWAPALLAGHSAWHELIRMVEIDAAIRAGDYFPSWSPDFYFGYGSPLFQFYSPFFYYLCEIPVLLGFGIPTALKITLFATLLASGVTMYHLGAAHVSRWAACFGAILYMVAPYRLVDLFVRHASAEHTAFLWLPLLVWGTERFVVRRSRTALAAGILAAAGLVLTHNIMALIGLPVCMAAGWLLSQKNRGWTTVLWAAIPGVLGLALATFFWWPALNGRGLTQAEESLTSGYFDYHSHFVGVDKWVKTAWGFGESGAGEATQMSLQIGWPHLVIGLAMLAVCFGRGRTRWSGVGIAIAIVALGMTNAISEPVWAVLPLLKYVQFPWRFLGLVVFGIAICGAALLDRMRALNPRLELPLFLVGILVVMGAYFPYYSTAQLLAADAETGALIQASPDQVAAMAEMGVLLPFDGVVTPATIRGAGERGTSQDDFLPRDVHEKPVAPAVLPIATSAGEVREWNQPERNRYRATVSLPIQGKVKLAQFWFPGWTAQIDGHPAPTEPSGKAAVVTCDVTAGDHVVEFHYDGLPSRRIGAIISLLALFLALAVMAGNKATPLERRGSAL